MSGGNGWVGYSVAIPRYTIGGPDHHAQMMEALAKLHRKRVTPDDADSAWIARELGDVPYDRVAELTCHDNPMSWDVPVAVWIDEDMR